MSSTPLPARLIPAHTDHPPQAKGTFLLCIQGGHFYFALTSASMPIGEGSRC